MKRRRSSSSPLQESPPINKKKIVLTESSPSSSSNSMKEPTINTVSPPPAKIQPNHFVSSSFTTPASPSLQVSPSLCSSNSSSDNVNSLASNSPVSCFNSKSSLPFKRPLPFKRRCNTVPLITILEKNEIHIVNSLVSCFNSKSSLPFEIQRNSVPLTTSENSSQMNDDFNSFSSLTEIAEQHNPPHPQPPHPNPDLKPPFHPPPPDPHPLPPLDPLPPNVHPPAVWRICCIGATRIGIVTMMMIANFCPNVHISIVDENLDVIHRAMQGQFPFYEPHLLLLHNHLIGLNPQRLRFSPDIEASILNADIIFIAVGIKSKVKPPAKKGKVEFSDWANVWKKLVRLQNMHNKVIVELTTLPLDFETLFGRAIGENLNTYRVVLNPSFISEGRAINDIHHPSMVVIATRDLFAAHALVDLYNHWVPLESIYAFGNLQSAVLAKLGLNSILASRVVLINTLNYIAELWGAERNQFSRIITEDYRVENEYFDPGVGFGGPGLEKCLDYLSEAASQKGLVDESRLFKQLVKSNETTRKRFVKEMQVDMGGTLEKRIAVLGFAYKKNTNSFENSPAIRICLELLREEGATLRIFDPIVPAAFTRRFFNSYRQRIQVRENPYEACDGTDAICILTDWDQFLNLDFTVIYAGMRPQHPCIFFGRHMNIHPPHLHQIGFRVYGIL